MAKIIKDHLKKIFIDNWFRKIIAFVIATVIWILVNDNLHSKKTYSLINLSKKELYI